MKRFLYGTSFIAATFSKEKNCCYLENNYDPYQTKDLYEFINFQEAVKVNDNLCGINNNLGPKTLVYEDVFPEINGPDSIDLVLSCINAKTDGFKAFASQPNLPPLSDEPFFQRFTLEQGAKVGVSFEFLEHESQFPVKLNELHLVIVDSDQGETNKEIVDVCGKNLEEKFIGDDIDFEEGYGCVRLKSTIINDSSNNVQTPYMEDFSFDQAQIAASFSMYGKGKFKYFFNVKGEDNLEERRTSYIAIGRGRTPCVCDREEFDMKKTKEKYEFAELGSTLVVDDFCDKVYEDIFPTYPGINLNMTCEEKENYSEFATPILDAYGFSSRVGRFSLKQEASVKVNFQLLDEYNQPLEEGLEDLYVIAMDLDKEKRVYESLSLCKGDLPTSAPFATLLPRHIGENVDYNVTPTCLSAEGVTNGDTSNNPKDVFIEDFDQYQKGVSVSASFLRGDSFQLSFSTTATADLNNETPIRSLMFGIARGLPCEDYSTH
eukprot:augustus_masked-scaffold_35-processed-gene-1.7-mRNA-1 protein AED:1.00 eAED:1.00 QI:0/-1/0/0/-1/1/1/0/489